MIHVPPERSEPVHGREVFIEMRKQFGDIYDEVLRHTKDVESSLTERDKVNISYLILFFGIGETSKFVLEHYIYNTHERFTKVPDDLLYSFAFEDKYEGHQASLGHYFRHLFQMVTFVENDNCLSDQEKYFYVKTVRAQLSTFELAIFFFNSISDFGQPWSKGGSNIIEKYQFLKNIPAHFTFGIDPKKYYPNIRYEYDEILVIPS